MINDWRLTESKLDRREDGWEAWHYTFKRDDGRLALFRVVGWTKPRVKGAPMSTGACRFTHRDQHGFPIFGEGVPSVKVMGECQVEMVRDRLLCGLRDGSVAAEASPALVDRYRRECLMPKLYSSETWSFT
jgi:hypothetical protein